MSPRNVSTDARFDDARYWQFSRQSGLPIGYFDRRRVSVDAVVVIVSIACAVIGLLVAA